MLSEETVEVFIDPFIALNSSNKQSGYTQTLIKGICLALKKYAGNEMMCLRLLLTLRNDLSVKESKLINRSQNMR